MLAVRITQARWSYQDEPQYDTDSNNGKANVPSWQLSNPHKQGLPITRHKTHFKASIIYLSDKSLLCCISSHRKSHYVLRACSALLVAKYIFISYTVHSIPVAPHILPYIHSGAFPNRFTSFENPGPKTPIEIKYVKKYVYVLAPGE